MYFYVLSMYINHSTRKQTYLNINNNHTFNLLFTIHGSEHVQARYILRAVVRKLTIINVKQNVNKYYSGGK